MFNYGDQEKMLKDLRSEVKDFSKNGKCSGCGSCCNNLLVLTSSEVKRIKAYINKHKIKEQKHLYPFAEAYIDELCPFLDISKKVNGCTIYKVRPQICREFSCSVGIPVQVKDLKSLIKDLKVVDMRKTFFK